ncbi:MAG: fasciclin domain-containing protein [Prolixibacteraceae bacterium]|nr:fasciclin domain-containing protein [Prolixibacteraceae bacterium]
MNRYKFFLIIALVMILSACKNVWEEHIKVNDNVLQENIMVYLGSDPEFSEFTSMLKSTGMDVYLSSSGIYTVWAPDNQAIAGIDPSLIDTDDKLRLFVSNHIVSGMYSTLANNVALDLKMKSGKSLSYDSSNDLIDGVTIDPSGEVTLKNGVVQLISQPLLPRYTIWDYIALEAPPGRFVDYLKSLTRLVFDENNSEQIGVDSLSQPVFDSIWIEKNNFFLYVTDISSEDSTLTLLIPGDEVFEAEFSKFEKYYRRDDKVSNVIPTARDSAYIKLMIARDLVFENEYTASDGPDTLVSYFDVKVPFNKASVTSSFQASNGYVHHVTDCSVKPSDKILPIVMEAENCIVGAMISSSGNYLTNTTSGTGTPYFRQRANASQGFDLIVDNSHKSERLSGALFAGPIVASMPYRVKIRAINDFNKSYRYPNSETVLKQWLGQVTITRDLITEEIKAISTATNLLNSGDQFGTPDVVYDPADQNTYYYSDTLLTYSPIENAIEDEVDLGYYNFSKSDSVYLRLIPQASQMAVTADYFRLVPIFE